MKKFFLILLGFLLIASGVFLGINMAPDSSTLVNAEIRRLEEDLSSPEGLMRLVPQLRNKNGTFEIPNPTQNLEQFLIVRQSLLNIIEMALARANTVKNPYQYSSQPHRSLKMGTNWLAAEVGFSTSAKIIPDFSKGGFGFYGGKSFLQGIVPVKGTEESFYTVPGSVVYLNLMPTSLACVNRIMETSGLNGGTMIADSYVLGDKNGQAYLVVNGCQNTAITITQGDLQLLTPGASSYLGMQWAEK